MGISLHMLCLYAYFFTQAITVTAQSTYTRTSLTGSDVTLPCDYNQATDGDWFLITWSVMLGGTFHNLYVRSPSSTANSVTPPDQFAGRISIDGERSLKLTGVTIADDDEYRCTVTATNTPQTLVNLQVFKQPTRPDVQVQFDPQPSDMSAVPLNTTVTFTCSSTGGRPPPTLGWKGAPESVNPTYTASNDSQGVGDATSTFNFTTTKYGMAYSVQCEASGPDPIQPRTSAVTSFTTEPGPNGSSAPQTEGYCSGPGVIAGAAVGCFIGGLLVGGAAVLLFLRFRTVKNSGVKKDTRDPADRQYENVAPPRATSQRPGSGSDEYEVPMETIQPPPQPPQPSDDYQELRPAIYQSLKKH